MIRDDLEEEKSHDLDLEDGVTVSQLLEHKGIEPQEVLVSRNGTIISGEHELEEGDELKVFDVIAGG